MPIGQGWLLRGGAPREEGWRGEQRSVPSPAHVPRTGAGAGAPTAPNRERVPLSPPGTPKLQAGACLQPAPRGRALASAHTGLEGSMVPWPWGSSGTHRMCGDRERDLSLGPGGLGGGGYSGETVPPSPHAPLDPSLPAPSAALGPPIPGGLPSCPPSLAWALPGVGSGLKAPRRPWVASGPGGWAEAGGGGSGAPAWPQTTPPRPQRAASARFLRGIVVNIITAAAKTLC